MAFGAKTNERPGTRAQLKYLRVSAYKAREVLNLIRGLPVGEAQDILSLLDRRVSDEISKVLASAVANAGNNDDIPADELFISACYADEGPTLRRYRPRARGRATRIRKRTTHITIIVARLDSDEIDRRRRSADEARSARSGQGAADRSRRVAKSRGEEPAEVEETTDEVGATEETTDEVGATEEADTTDEVGATEEADTTDEGGATEETDSTEESSDEAGFASTEAAEAAGFEAAGGAAPDDSSTTDEESSDASGEDQ